MLEQVAIAFLLRAFSPGLERVAFCLPYLNKRATAEIGRIRNCSGSRRTGEKSRKRGPALSQEEGNVRNISGNRASQAGANHRRDKAAGQRKAAGRPAGRALDCVACAVTFVVNRYTELHLVQQMLRGKTTASDRPKNSGHSRGG